MTEVKPGYVIDLAVGEALGWDGRIEILETTLGGQTRSCIVHGKRWNPSENANDALEAAEEFGLLHPDKYCGRIVQRFNRITGCLEHQVIVLADSERDGVGVQEKIFNEKTIPLAICAAIIKLSEETSANRP